MVDGFWPAQGAGAPATIYEMASRDLMRLLAAILGLISAFFAYYTTRLLVITEFLRRTRAGGQGAYIGAVVFPLLALVCGWAAIRAWRRGGGS